MPTGIAGRGAIAGQLTGTGVHGGPALAALVGDFAARLQYDGLLVGAVAQLIAVGERRQVLQIYAHRAKRLIMPIYIYISCIISYNRSLT